MEARRTTRKRHSRGPTAENGQPIRLPSLAEYRRLRDDPETQWLFDDDGFCIAGVARAKSNPAK